MRGYALVAALAAAVAALGTAALAKPGSKTEYVYYAVGGADAASLHNALVRRGPHLNGKRAYAITSMKSSERGRLVQGASCFAADYDIEMSFKIRLPKLKSEANLSASTRRGWGQFSTFVKAHEERHRAIWLDCAGEIEARVLKVKTKSCKTWDDAAAKVVKSLVAACNKRHAAFDVAEQKRLARQPFLKLAFGGGGSSKALPVKKKKRKK